MTEEMSTALYGRRLSLKIVCNPAAGAATGDVVVVEQDGFEPDPIRVVFDINYPGFEAFFISEISLYNLTEALEEKLITEGSAVYLSAGYQKGQFGKIFSGYVLQSLYEREGVVDYKLTLRCIDGYKMFHDNFAAFTLNKGYTQQTLVNQIASRSINKIPIKSMTDKLEQLGYPRGATGFSTPASLLRETLRWGGVEKASNTQMFFTDNELNIGKLVDQTEGIVVVSPGAGGLIGTPQQIDYGVSFRCLLNPQLILKHPPIAVKIDQSGARQLKAQYTKAMSQLDQDGLYRVIGVRHIGDTRGNAWYTDVTGVNVGGKVSTGLYVPSMLPDITVSGT